MQGVSSLSRPGSLLTDPFLKTIAISATARIGGRNQNELLRVLCVSKD
jgi:hypothetical protein